MKEGTFEWICILTLTLGQLFVFAGYDTQSFIVEPVLHSVHNRHSDAIHAHSGYYGQSLTQISYVVMCFIAPSIVGVIGSKWTLFIGSSLFTLHLTSFFYVHYIPYYATALTLGLGFALYYVGFGGYITEHSSRKTIERNSTLTWTLASSSMSLGGILLMFTIEKPAAFDVQVSNSTSIAGQQQGKSFSDSEIRLIYAGFAMFTLFANITFLLIPRRRTSDCLEAQEDKEEKATFGEHFKKTITLLVDYRMIQMAPVHGLCGTINAFWMVIFPTTLTFTQRLSANPYVLSWYSIALGIFDVFVGLVVVIFCRRFSNFGQKPNMTIGCISFLAALVLFLLSTPFNATRAPSNEASLLFESNVFTTVLIGCLLGAADNCSNTSKGIISALVMPEARAQAYSIAKLHQSLFESLLMAISPFLTVPWYCVILTINTLLALAMYYRTANHIRKRELTESSTSHAELVEDEKCSSPRDFPSSLQGMEENEMWGMHSRRASYASAKSQSYSNPSMK